MPQNIYDYIIIGSGFGGSVSAMRLTEKGYSVLVLERGKRFEDQDFPKRNWNIWKYLWMPALRCFGILELSLFKGLFVFRGSGVGGGSLVYAGVHHALNLRPFRVEHRPELLRLGDAHEIVAVAGARRAAAQASTRSLLV